MREMKQNGPNKDNAKQTKRYKKTNKHRKRKRPVTFWVDTQEENVRSVTIHKRVQQSYAFQQITGPGHGDRSKISLANTMVSMGSTSTAMKKQLRSETTYIVLELAFQTIGNTYSLGGHHILSGTDSKTISPFQQVALKKNRVSDLECKKPSWTSEFLKYRSLQ